MNQLYENNERLIYLYVDGTLKAANISKAANKKKRYAKNSREFCEM